MCQSTKDRNKASKLSKTNYKEALKLARKISDPWFRCQALSDVSRNCNDKLKSNIALLESFEAAEEMADPNRSVTVSSWPLEVLIYKGSLDEAEEKIETLLSKINNEPSPVKRSDALKQILKSVSYAPEKIYLLVCEPFAQACLEKLENGKRNTKGESTLVGSLSDIAKVDYELALKLSNLIEGPNLNTKARSILAKIKC